ncbi:MAG: redoxin domain-containing protein [Candidatus Azobacteroides sp.]|nr:redoxin domain-containing protein [Candidatus Azobacteroides sp.]
MNNLTIKIIRFILPVLLLASCGEEKEGFSVKGRVQNMEEKKIFAVYWKSDKTICTDTLLLSKNGHFKMDGNMDSVGVVTLLVNRRQWTSVFVHNGDDVSVTMDAQYPDLAQVKGGKLNDDLYDFKKNIKNLIIEKDEISKVVAEACSGEEINTAVIETLNPKLANLNHALSLSAEHYVKDHPESLVSTVVMLDFLCLEENTEKLTKTLSLLEEPAKSFYLAEYMRSVSKNMQNVEIGKKAPSFVLPDTLGHNVSLSDFRGKYVLLHFWISNDPFSRIHNRLDLENIHQNYREKKDFSLLGISLDLNKESWKQSVKQDNMTWCNVSDLKGLNSEVVKSYGVVFVPRNFLINPSGTIIARDVTLNDLKSVLR